MKRIMLVFAFIILSPLLNSAHSETEYPPAKFNYNIDAKLLPEKDELIGSYTARFMVSDTNISKEFVIYAPEKPKNNRNYLALSVLYNEDPMKTWTYDEYIEIEKIEIDGEEYDLSGAVRDEKFLRIRYEHPKEINSIVTVFVKFKTHYLGVKNHLYVAMWYPYLGPSNYNEIKWEGVSSNVILNIPKNYKLVANCESIDTLGNDITDGNYTTYNLIASNLGCIIWIASPRLKMVYQSGSPIDWSLWSDANHVPKQIIDVFEEQMRNYLELFGFPTSKKAHLTVCLISLGDYMGGGSSGNLIVLDAGLFKWAFMRGLYPVISHELSHFWWTSHDYGTYTKKDITFVESFNDHLLYFYKDKIVWEKPGRILNKLASGLFKSLDRFSLYEYKVRARSGRHYPVFPKSMKSLYDDDTGYLMAEDMEDKGTILLNALSKQFSRDEWDRKIKCFFKETRNKAMTFDLFCRLNPDIEPILNEWFNTAGDFDYALGKIRCDKGRDSYYHTVIPVINKGALSSDIEMLVKYDDGTTSLDTVRMNSREVDVEKVSKCKVAKVVIDPNRLIPDFDRTNNRNFRSVRFSLFGGNCMSDSLDSYLVSFVGLPIPLPHYSDETGFSLSKNLLTLKGLTKSFGCAGKIMDDYFNLKAGYNFRASEVVWDLSYHKVMSTSAIKSFLAYYARIDPEFFTSTLNFQFMKTSSWDRPPVDILKLGPYYRRLRRPEYRSEVNWATGNLMGLQVSYKAKNVVSFKRKVRGYILSISADKVFGGLGSDWDFERAMMQMELYSPIGVRTVLASRLFAGHLWGYAPMQERFDLARHGLFSATRMYSTTARCIFSFDTELRLAKMIPLFDLAVFSRNSWVQDYSHKRFEQYDEAGLSFRLFGFLLFDISLWNKRPYSETTNNAKVTFSFIYGVPFKYSSTRWYR